MTSCRAIASNCLPKSGVGGWVAQPSPVGTSAPDPQPHQLRVTACGPGAGSPGLRPAAPELRTDGDVVRGCAPRTHPNHVPGGDAGAGYPRARDWPKPTSWVCHHRPPRVSQAESRIHAGRPLVPCHAAPSAHDRGDRGPCSNRTGIRPNRRDVRLFADYRMSDNAAIGLRRPGTPRSPRRPARGPRCREVPRR